ncbi:hypothetical protein FKP32DRAFT_995294 [Trametes sanguinea]|nr:hypothetical protein FKP32DRAFT_995294 [Trametes sanguinea]
MRTVSRTAFRASSFSRLLILPSIVQATDICHRPASLLRALDALCLDSAPSDFVRASLRNPARPDVCVCAESIRAAILDHVAGKPPSGVGVGRRRRCSRSSTPSQSYGFIFDGGSLRGRHTWPGRGCCVCGMILGALKSAHSPAAQMSRSPYLHVKASCSTTLPGLAGNSPVPCRVTTRRHRRSATSYAQAGAHLRDEMSMPGRCCMSTARADWQRPSTYTRFWIPGRGGQSAKLDDVCHANRSLGASHW